MKTSEGYTPAPESGLFLSPVFRAHTGHLPPIKKGERVVMWFAAAWRIGYVKARLPGDVYRVEFLKSVNGCKEAFLSCNTYGGPVDQSDSEEDGE